EDGDTHSIVSGDIDVGGELTVTANQSKDQIDVKRAFAIPGIAVGISSSASVGGTSTGDLLADIKEGMKTGGKAGAGGAAKFAWAKTFGKKASDAVDEKAKKSGGEKNPSNVNEQLDKKKKASSGIPFNVGGALTIINDTNAVLASIGASTQTYSHDFPASTLSAMNGGFTLGDGTTTIIALDYSSGAPTSLTALANDITSHKNYTDLLFTVKENVSENRLDFIYENADTLNYGKKPQLHYQLAGTLGDDLDLLSLLIDRPFVEHVIDPGFVDIDVAGNFTLDAVVNNRPDILAAADVENTQSQKQKDAGQKGDVELGLAMAVSFAFVTNTAESYITDTAVVDVAGTLTVTSSILNEIDPNSSWGFNLVNAAKAENNTPDFVAATETDPVSIFKNTTVDVNFSHGSESARSVENFVDAASRGTGDKVKRYRYIASTPLLAAVLKDLDYTDTTLWEDIGWIDNQKTENFVKTLTVYGNLGLDYNLIDSWSQATGNGQKRLIMGALTFFQFDHKSKAVIKSGALINTDSDQLTTEDKQAVVVKAVNVNHMVNLSGNFKTFGIQGVSNKKISQWRIKDMVQKPGAGGSLSGDDAGAAGFGIGIYTMDNNTQAIIEEGATVNADSLEVDANNRVINVGFVASGVKAAAFGFAGTAASSVINNVTTASIKSQNVNVSGKLINADSDDPSLKITATDNTVSVMVAGGVAISERMGVGASVALNVVNRNTEASLFNVDRNNSADKILSGGHLVVAGVNQGFVGSISVSGAVASGAPKRPEIDSTQEFSQDNPLAAKSLGDSWADRQAAMDKKHGTKEQRTGGSKAASDAGSKAGSDDVKKAVDGFAASVAASITIV
ncbi:hypothetical protein N9141_01325, partial [bacterium]|nr:hypothetical protein [bacterium]